jgi:hypothetical protein
MKKVLVLVAAMMAVVSSAKAEVAFAYEAGAEIVSAYIWRGQYNGGLSFQPEVLIGFDSEHTAFRIGAWSSLGASDWTFRKDQGDGTAFTRFMPELDIIGSFTACGLSVGFNHYYYCDGTNFFNWKSVADIDAQGGTSTTEVWTGYNFSHFFGGKAGAYINWYTTVAGGDLLYDETTGEARRAWSSYLEVGYDYTFESVGITLGAQVGMSPWASDLYGNSKFAVVNVSAKIDKEWEFDKCSINLFALGSINPNGLVSDPNNPEYNLLLWKAAGDDKLYTQRLNGVIGLGIWF